VVPPSWLDECVSERAHVNPKVYKHRFTTSGQRLKDCKVLNKDTISSTGFDLEERNFLQRQVEVLGGCFDSQLCRDTCTVLIAKTATGKKYDSARQWNITVASQTWLQECILRGARRDPSCFGLQGIAMPGGDGRQSEHGAKTSLECGKDMPTQSFSCSQHSQGTQQSSQTNGPEGGMRIGADSYLEDHKIFFASDIPSSERTELMRLCRAARATTISADLTGLPRSRGITVIVSGNSDLSDELVHIQQSCELWPPCVGAGWVRQCAVERRCIDAQHYALKKAPDVIAPPARKAGLSLMAGASAKAMSSGGELRVNGHKGLTINTAHSRLPEAGGEVVPSSVRTAPSSGGSAAASAGSEGAHRGGMLSNSAAGAAKALALEEVPETLCSQATPDSGAGRCERKGIFEGKAFTLAGLSATGVVELTKMIKEAGGTVGSPGSGCDYEVTPLAQATFGCRGMSRSSSSRRETVSEYWVRKCCALEKVLPPRSHKLYQPLNRPLEIQGAQIPQLCVSGMHGAAKRLVFWLAAQCSMRIQLDLDRKRTTHLITCTHGDTLSEKQHKAAKWKINITSLAWLEECVAAGSVRDDVTAFPPGQELDYVPAPQIDPMVQKQAGRNGAVMRRTPLTLTVVKSTEPHPSVHTHTESPQKSTSSPADDEGRCAKEDCSPSKVVSPQFADGYDVKFAMAERARAPQALGREKQAAHRAGDGESARILTPNFAHKKRKVDASNDILTAAGFDFSLYKRTKPSTQNSCAPSPLGPRAAGTVSANAATPAQVDRAVGQGEREGGQGGKEAAGTPSLSRIQDAVVPAVVGGRVGDKVVGSEHRGSAARACEVELKEVLQNLESSTTKTSALPVKRRRVAQEEDYGGERDNHWVSAASSAFLAAGERQGPVGRGSANSVDLTPQTAPRGRSSGAKGGSGTAAAGRGRRKGRGSPRKMRLRRRQFTNHESDEEEDGGGDDDDSEDAEEEEVQYAPAEGQKNLEALMGRVKAAGRAAAKKPAPVGDAVSAPAPLARRSSRCKT
jgi:hypothetical protein